MKNLKFTVLLLVFICHTPLFADNNNVTEADCPQAKIKSGSGLYIFSVHDIDKSGTLSKEEYQLLVEQVELRRKSTGRPMRRFSPALSFDEIDINKDGQISEDELLSALNNRLRQHRRYRYKSN